MPTLDEIKRLADKAAEQNDQSIETTDISRPINWSRWADYPEFNTALDTLTEEVEQQEKRKRNRNPEDREKLRDVLGALVINLYEARIAHTLGTVGIRRDKKQYVSTGDYSIETRFYSGIEISYVLIVTSSCNGLEALGYITKTKKGYINRATKEGKTTRYRATDKLMGFLSDIAQLTPKKIIQRINTPHVVLRNQNKQDIPYHTSLKTEYWEAELSTINECLKNTWLDLCISDDKFERLQMDQYGKHLSDYKRPSSVDFNSCTLRRIFSNCDFEQGGRFYGGWWQGIPSKYRRHIHIDGKDTVEIDYSSMHPVILYESLGISCPELPYDIGLDQVDRDHIKTAFNALLNAKGKPPKCPKEYDPEQQGSTWTKLLDTVKEKHKLIQDQFETGVGLRLQRIDADIASKVMLHFVERGYPCLPVHDSFIVHHAMADELQEVMEEEFYKHFRTVPKTKITKKKEYTASYPAVPVDMEDLSFLNNDGPYSKYHAREALWRS